MDEMEQVVNELIEIKVELAKARKRARRFNDAVIFSVTVVGMALALFINGWAVLIVFIAGLMGFTYRAYNAD